MDDISPAYGYDRDKFNVLSVTATDLECILTEGVEGYSRCNKPIRLYRKEI
jgi:hypothetical protein